MNESAISSVWWPHDEFYWHTQGADCFCKPRVCADCKGVEHHNPPVGKIKFRQSWCERCNVNRWNIS